MRDNYRTQMEQATGAFLGYDQEMLIRKHSLSHDENYLYTELFSQKVRIDRKNGHMEVFQGTWEDGARFGRVMTLLDLLCDSSETRKVSGKMQSMAAFGLQFHSGLVESDRSGTAEWMEAHVDFVESRCLALGGQKVAAGDLCYDIPVFQDLKIRMQLWFADEDFPAQLSWFWDANALQYLHYETMYYAVGLLIELLTGQKGR